MKRIILIVGLLTVLLATGASNGVSTANAMAKQTVKIGALLTLTGEWSAEGAGAHKALIAGLEQANHYLAPAGLRFELDIKDTAGNPQIALTELASLAKAGVRVVIGPQSSEEAHAVNHFAAEHDIVLISPSATAPDLSQKDTFFRVIPTDWNQADGLLKIMAAGKINRFVIVYRNDTYGIGFQRQLRQDADAYGIEMIAGIALPKSSNDYPAAIAAAEEQLTANNLQQTALIFIGSATEAGGFIQGIAESSPLSNVKWLAGADIVNSKAFLENPQVAGFSAKVHMEGLSVGYQGIALDVLPYINYFLNDAADISPYALTTWDALWLITETYHRNPTASPETLMTELRSTANQFRNSFGLINVMDENGDTRSARFLRYQIAPAAEGRYIWQSKGHYVNPVISAPFIHTIMPQIRQKVGEVPIGALLSLSGASAETSREVQAVLQEAVDCFNKYSKKLGSDLTIKLLIEDTGGNPQTAALAAKKLINQGVHSLIGPLNSAELAAVAPLLNSPDVLSISPLSTAPSLSKKDHIYRMVMDDTHQSHALSALLQQDQINNVIVLYRNDLYGQDLTAAFRSAYPGTVQAIGYVPNAKDFKAVQKQAEQLAAKADAAHTAILAISYDEIAALMNFPTTSPLHSLRWYGTDSTALTGVLLHNKSTAKTAAALQFTAPGHSAYGNYFDALYPVVNYRLAQKINHPLQESSLAAFDALWILGCAYLENGNVAQDRIEKYVQRAAFRGLSGLVAFNDSGDRKLGYYRIYRMENKSGNYRWVNTGLYSLDYAKKGVIELTR